MKLLKKALIPILMIIFLSVFNLPIFNQSLMFGSVVEAASISINSKSKTLKVKQTYTLKINGTKKKVVWSSSNRTVAIVSSKGKVTAKKKGTVTITAKVNGKKYKCKITVKNSTSSTVYITKSGKKYHRAGCRYLSRSCFKINKSTAKSRGYSACKICKP